MKERRKQPGRRKSVTVKKQYTQPIVATRWGHQAKDIPRKKTLQAPSGKEPERKNRAAKPEKGGEWRR